MNTWKLTIGIEKGVSVINLYYNKRRLRYWNGKAIGLKLLSREKPELLKAAFELRLNRSALTTNINFFIFKH